MTYEVYVKAFKCNILGYIPYPSQRHIIFK